MNKIIIWGIAQFILMTIMVIGAFVDFGKKTILKKIIEIIVIIGHFAVLVIWYDFLLENRNMLTPNFLTGICVFNIVSSVLNFWTFTSQIPLFRKCLIGKLSKEQLVIVISVSMGMFLSLAEIYFSLYIINPDWFNISKNTACDSYRTAFEFIYYTFAVTITYSGSGIEAIGVIPKIVQMLHVLFFYLFAGDAILQLIRND